MIEHFAGSYERLGAPQALTIRGKSNELVVPTSYLGRHTMALAERSMTHDRVTQSIVRAGAVIGGIIVTLVAASCRRSTDGEVRTAGEVWIDKTPEQITYITANHDQGSISFVIDGANYFYYVQSKGASATISATSALLSDIRQAQLVQICSVPYGLHRRIVNLLLFYGTKENIGRVILEHEGSSRSKAEKEKRDANHGVEPPQ